MSATTGNVEMITDTTNPFREKDTMCGQFVIMPKDYFDRILAEFDFLNERLEYVSLSCKMPETIDIADIVKLKGISRTQIMEKERYLLPNFGHSQYPDGPTRWDYSIYEAWNRRPISDRKKEYEALLETERKLRIVEKEQQR